MPPAQVAGDREALAPLKRLSEARLELFDSQPALASTVEAWLSKKLEKNNASKLLDAAGVAELISKQQVLQLLSAALTTLLKGLAATKADECFQENQINAFQQLGCSLSFGMSACREIWDEDRSSRDKQERQKAALQLAKPGVCWLQL
jgi:hypothetical protein